MDSQTTQLLEFQKQQKQKGQMPSLCPKNRILMAYLPHNRWTIENKHLSNMRPIRSQRVNGQT